MITINAIAHLDPDFRQIDLHGQLLAAVHVRVMGLLERSLKLVQLIGGERGAVPAVLLLVGRRHATGRGRGRRARPATGHVLVVRLSVAAVAAPAAAAVVHVAGPSLLQHAAAAAASTAAPADTATVATADTAAADLLVRRHVLTTRLLGIAGIATVLACRTGEKNNVFIVLFIIIF